MRRCVGVVKGAVHAHTKPNPKPTLTPNPDPNPDPNPNLDGLSRRCVNRCSGFGFELRLELELGFRPHLYGPPRRCVRRCVVVVKGAVHALPNPKPTPTR